MVEAGVNFVIHEGEEVTVVTGDGLPPELAQDPRIQSVLAWQKNRQMPVIVAIDPGTTPPKMVILNAGEAFKAADPKV